MNGASKNNTGKISGGGSFCGFLTCLVVCATIIAVAYLYLTPHVAGSRRLWVPIVVEPNGSQTALGETRQLEFWTPSTKTVTFLHKKNDDFDPKEKWQVIASEDVLQQFGDTLHTNQNVFGYRRIEVWGQGRTNFKPGWWWTVNVSTNFSATNLTDMYHSFWKMSGPVLVEVIDNRGSDVK